VTERRYPRFELGQRAVISGTREVGEIVGTALAAGFRFYDVRVGEEVRELVAHAELEPCVRRVA
jgi:hypothetical protein